jgi:hypothetical protein
VNSDVCPLFFQLGGDGALRKAFERAGFTDCREERRDRALEFAGEREVLSAMFAGGPVALAYSKFSPQDREAVHREYLDSVEAHRRDGGAYHIPGEFVFVAGTKA